MDFKKLKTTAVDFYHAHKLPVLVGSGALVIALLAGILLPSLLGGDDEPQMRFVAVSRGSITDSIDVVGTLEAQPFIELAWESGGIVSPFDLSIGDMVQKRDVLMTLEDSSLSTSILQAQSDILEAQANLDNLLIANSALYTAAQELTDAEYMLRDYQYDRDKWNYNNAPDEQVEEYRANYYDAEEIVWEKEAAFKAVSDIPVDDPEREKAYEEMKEAMQNRDNQLRYLNNLLGTYYDHEKETDFIEYDLASAQVEELRIEYLRYLDQSEEIAAAEAAVQALQNTIDMARIIAPFDGTVTEISAVGGEKVANGATAVRLDNMDNLVVEVYVSEVDINDISLGLSAVLTFDAIPGKEYEGLVQSISAAGSDDSGVVEFRVSVKVLTADESVKPGFTAVVSVVTSEVADALLVPSEALVSLKGNSAVILSKSDGSTVMVPVETGESSDVHMEIISGEIKEGDTLAIQIDESSGFPGLAGMGQMRNITGAGSGGGK